MWLLFGVGLHRHTISEVSIAGPHTVSQDRLIPALSHTQRLVLGGPLDLHGHEKRF